MAGYKGMPKTDPEKIKRDLLDAMDDIINEGHRKLKGLTDQWNHDVVYSKSKAKAVGDDAKASIITEDDAFYYLDGGTSRRHAVLSYDFAPKTAVRSFKSSDGAGRVVAISKRPVGPGIKARQWTDILDQSMFTVLRLSVDAILAGDKRMPQVGAVRIHVWNPP